MDVQVAGGALDLEFLPEPGASWLVSGLVFARRTPKIAHVPAAGATPGGRVRLGATITAPDGVASAVLHYRVEPGGAAGSLPLPADGHRFAADLAIDRRHAGREIRYAIAARDGRGSASRLPPRGDFVLRLLDALPR